MDTETQKKLKTMLSQELRKLETELRSIGRINPDNPKDWEAVPDKMDIFKADPNEVADGIASYEENTAILKQLEIRADEVKAALKRMEEGTYGSCNICGKNIEKERLLANPAATTCIEHRS